VRAVFVLFDTLSRRSLEAYGGRDAIPTPNFSRLARRALRFDRHYVGSLPCIPARREVLTGRHNFLHRSWGPIEPFDKCFTDLLRAARGTYSHLVTDHCHYWEDGGATYHTRFNSFEFVRGQENDFWQGLVAPDIDDWKRRYHPIQNDGRPGSKFRRNMANREAIRSAKDYPIARTFDLGLQFLERNRDADNWFLQIETFDPHEPFEAPPELRAEFPTNYRGPILDYPTYGWSNVTGDEAAELRANYAATLTHCDRQLGRLLDLFDAQDMWKDTALILSTDHGFLLGERDLWGKLIVPVYQEIAHIPLFLHHPGIAAQGGGTRRALTQTTDLMPTILDLFGVPPPPEVTGHSLLPLVARDGEVRRAALYGQHGSAINVTDGRYTWFRYPRDLHGGNLNQYTLMPTHIMSLFGIEELKEAALHPPFDFTQGVPVLRIPCTPKSQVYQRHGAGAQLAELAKTMLYDIETDPEQLHPIEDARFEARLTAEMVAIMRAHDAPRELYRRFDLDA
jgi:arylsulfatase A-like enzyme